MNIIKIAAIVLIIAGILGLMYGGFSYWVLGFTTSYTMGGLIYALLVIAVVMILVRVIQGQRL